MTCARCQDDGDVGPTGWCADCEREYDTWVRRHASDILGPVLAAMTIVTVAGMVIPLLGYSMLFATTGVFGGFAALLGLDRVNRRRRRRQFLQAPLPRAYLPTRT